MAILVEEMYHEDIVENGGAYAKGLSDGSDGLDFRVMLFGFATIITTMARTGEVGGVADIIALVKDVAETQFAFAASVEAGTWPPTEPTPDEA